MRDSSGLRNSSAVMKQSLGKPLLLSLIFHLLSYLAVFERIKGEKKMRHTGGKARRRKRETISEKDGRPQTHTAQSTAIYHFTVFIRQN